MAHQRERVRKLMKDGSIRTMIHSLLTISLFVFNAAHPARALSGAPLSVEQRETVRAVVRARLEIERRLKSALTELGQKYPGIDFNSVYADRDLVNETGILASRLRLAAYSAMTEELNVIVNEHWDAVEELYISNKLGEPYGLQVREAFAKSEPRVRARYSAWMQAMRENGEAIMRLLDFAEKQGGNVRFEAEHLVFSSSAATLEYARLKQQEAEAQQRNDSVRSDALGATDGVTEVLRGILTR